MINKGAREIEIEIEIEIEVESEMENWRLQLPDDGMV